MAEQRRLSAHQQHSQDREMMSQQQTTMLRDENAALKQQLERKQQENQQLKKTTATLERALEEKEREVERLKSQKWPCTRSDCQQTQREVQTVKPNLQASLQAPCRRPECADAHQRILALESEKASHQRLQQQQLRELSSAKEKLQKVTKERDEIRGNLQHAKVQIKQMERMPCSSTKCSNEHAKRLLSVVGDKLQVGSTQVSVTEILQFMDKKLEMLLESRLKQTGPSSAATIHLQQGPCENDVCAQQKDGLQRQVDDLTSQLYGPKCQRMECVKLRQDLQQKEVDEFMSVYKQARSIGKDMEIIRGGEYTELIARYEALTTSPDGLLGELKEVMEPFEAKLVFSKILKFAHTQSRETVIEALKTKLEDLFVLHKNAPTEEMEDASRGYGWLLHASGLKANQAAHVAALTRKLRGELESPTTSNHPATTFQKIFQKQPSILDEVVELAWEMVVLPNPMVISEPDTIAGHTHERELGYWDHSNPGAKLIYLRPVVYRSYMGDLACKAWVANSETKVSFQPPTCSPD